MNNNYTHINFRLKEFLEDYVLSPKTFSEIINCTVQNLYVDIRKARLSRDVYHLLKKKEYNVEKYLIRD
jgi:hypothetical protein